MKKKGALQATAPAGQKKRERRKGKYQVYQKGI